jgi:hypothetical protein
MLYSRPGTAEGAIAKFRLVRFGSTDAQFVQAAAVTDRIAGVYVGPADAADGAAIEVCLLGECFLEVSGAIGRGMTLTTNASGQGVNTTPPGAQNNKAAAVALISGTNTVIPVLVVPHWYQG